MKTLDMTTTRVVIVPTAVVTSVMINVLNNYWSWPLAYTIGAVAGLLRWLGGPRPCTSWLGRPHGWHSGQHAVPHSLFSE